MGKRRNTVEEDVGRALDHWSISSKAKENFELYDPDRDEENGTPEQEHRGSISDRQNLTVKNRPSEPPAQKRTFNRPGDLSDTAFEATDNIPKRHFFYYYNALHDVVLPQLNPMSSLILCVLFRKSHGFNRNWCQASFPELEQLIGASRNPIRTNLNSMIEDGWICIVSDGRNEATTYGLRLPVEIDEE